VPVRVPDAGSLMSVRAASLGASCDVIAKMATARQRSVDFEREPRMRGARTIKGDEDGLPGGVGRA
jgi:hypothetical protein